ncbi:MAG: hypothetical protein ABL967_17675 [Bryobacteraceae bacterium]
MKIRNRLLLTTAALAFLTSPAYAVHFTLASAVGNTWTYTLTFDPLDNYCVQGGACTATVRLAGLSGVTSATAPTSSDAGGGGAGNLRWLPAVENGGTGVVWQMTNGGTGNMSNPVHVFGFTVTAPGAVTGVASVITSEFCRDDGSPCTSLNIDTAVAGPVAATAGTIAGSIAQTVSSGGWGTLFTLVNTGSSAANVTLNFFANSGVPMSPSFSALPSATSSVNASLNAGASVVIDTNDSGPAQQEGWTQLASTGTLAGFGVFRFPASKWEAVVPLETRNADRYILAFDNTGVLATGVAVANLSVQPAGIPVIIRDENGAQIGTAVLTLTGRGHTSFLLNAQYSATIGRRGTIEFSTPGFGTPGAGRISVLGLRANGSALTTLPIFANVDSSGGSIAHTTFHGEFSSTFYVVNTGSTSAQFTLSFYDELGFVLPVPLTLVPSGSTVIEPSLTLTLGAGAMTVIETASQSALQGVVGSAQLLTTGNVSAFEVFKWLPYGQEASVPLETRVPAAFLLPFDNTNGLTTGVAIANLGSFVSNVTMNLRDTGGSVFYTTAISVVPRGHSSFMLPTGYPAAASRRGVAEFLVPSIPLGQKISVIGLRAKADGTLTTIPLLTK